MIKPFLTMIVTVGLLAACSKEETSASKLQGADGYTFEICNDKDINLYLLSRLEEGSETTVSGWHFIPARTCINPSWDRVGNTYYIQSEQGRFIPGGDSYAYDLSNEGIICLNHGIDLGWNGRYAYNGFQVFSSGQCASGLRVPSLSFKRNLASTDDGGVYTFRLKDGRFDASDKLTDRSQTPQKTPLQIVKEEINAVKQKIKETDNNLEKCSRQIGVWSSQKVFSLDVQEIVAFSACGNDERRLAIKDLIDKAKEETRRLFDSLLNATAGFFTRVLGTADTVLADQFGFDAGALSSYLTDYGSEWSQKPAGSFAPDLNAMLDGSYGKDHKLFLQATHDGLKTLVSQGLTIQANLNDEYLALAYLQNSASVREHLEGRDLEHPSDTDAEGWPKDSPVPPEVRQAVKTIVSVEKDRQDIQRAERLELILKQWRSDGVPENVIRQRLAFMESIKVLGAGFYTAASQTQEALGRLRSILDGAIEAAKDVTSCVVKVGAAGDFSDWYEITNGRDICSGAELSISGRVVSAAGLLIGSAKFWRLMAESSGLAVNSKRVFKETEVVLDSAKALGITSADETKLWAKALSAPKVNPFELAPTHTLTMSNREFNALKVAMQKDGMLRDTIKTVTHNGQKYIVDGHHRARAAKELGWKDVPVEEVTLPFLGYKTIDDLFN